MELTRKQRNSVQPLDTLFCVLLSTPPRPRQQSTTVSIGHSSKTPLLQCIIEHIYFQQCFSLAKVLLFQFCHRVVGGLYEENSAQQWCLL